VSSGSVNTTPEWAHLFMGEEDYRGRYGYGRPAHGSDPSARYGFPDPKLPGGVLTQDEAGDE